MYCPTCGLAEDRQVQYCRTCGTDLRGIRAGLAAPEGQKPAANAREEIGRALAARVWGLDDLSELEDALPAIEKFLESPAERRLRRIRAGTICAAIGLGATVFFTLFAMMQRDLVFAPGLGIVLFLIGIGLIVNGKFLTETEDRTAPKVIEPPDELVRRFAGEKPMPAALPTGEYLVPPASVTENTTPSFGSRPESTRPLRDRRIEMSERDTFASLRRSQEEKYFLEREQELLAKLRRRLELAGKLGEMADETQAANEALLQDLVKLGYTRETLPLIYLAPMVYIAWAEGFVADGERGRVMQIARERGIQPGTPADSQLSAWLDERPPDELMEKSIGIVQAVMHTHPASVEATEKAGILADVQRVVDSSGDVLLLWHQINANEQAAIQHLVDELAREHYGPTSGE